MKILALEKEVPGVSEDQFTDDILKAEARKAWELYQSGVLRGKKGDRRKRGGQTGLRAVGIGSVGRRNQRPDSPIPLLNSQA